MLRSRTRAISTRVNMRLSAPKKTMKTACSTKGRALAWSSVRNQMGASNSSATSTRPCPMGLRANDARNATTT